jgi:hypothetical protein
LILENILLNYRNMNPISSVKLPNSYRAEHG